MRRLQVPISDKDHEWIVAEAKRLGLTRAAVARMLMGKGGLGQTPKG